MFRFVGPKVLQFSSPYLCLIQTTLNQNQILHFLIDSCRDVRTPLLKINIREHKNILSIDVPARSGFVWSSRCFWFIRIRPRVFLPHLAARRKLYFYHFVNRKIRFLLLWFRYLHTFYVLLRSHTFFFDDFAVLMIKKCRGRSGS